MCLIRKVTLYTGVNVFHLDSHLFSWQSLLMTIVTYSTSTLTSYLSEAQRKVAEHQQHWSPFPYPVTLMVVGKTLRKSF